MTDLQTCSACERALPTDGFYLRKSGPRVGLRINNICKDCTIARSRARYAAKRTLILEQQTEYRKRNADKIRDQRLAAYAANPQKFRDLSRQNYAASPLPWRARVKAYRVANLDACRARERAWAIANHERVAETGARYRARRRGAPVVEHIDRAAIIARDRRVCHICRKRVPDHPGALHLDHLIPLSKGGSHTADNLAVAHAFCNQSRHDGRLPAQLRLIG